MQVKNSSLLVLIILLIIVNSLNTYNIYEKTRFRPSKITGRSTDSGTVTLFVVSADCYWTLTQGWNHVSVCLDVVNKSIKSVLEPIEDDYRFVLEWNESSQEFLIFSPKSSNPPFNTFDMNKSYFIYYNQPSEVLDLDGTEFGDINISLLQGWDSPTYPYTFTANLTKYLDTIGEDNYRFVLKWNASAQEFLIFSPKSADPPFDTIEMGEGQFIYITNPGGAVLKYNKTDLSS